MLTPFGKIVRCARVNCEISLTEMAKALNMSVSFLSMVENGKKEIPSDLPEKIKKFFKNKGFEIDFEDSILCSSRYLDLSNLSPAQIAVISKVVNCQKPNRDDLCEELLTYLPL